MIIDLNIRDNSYISAYVIRENFNRYIKYFDIKNYLYKETEKINKVNIIDGNITIETNDFTLNIKNYRNNKDAKLSFIIERAIEYKQKERKSYLKKQKIRRARTFGGVVVLSLGIIASNALSKDSTKVNAIREVNSDYKIMSTDENVIIPVNDKKEWTPENKEVEYINEIENTNEVEYSNNVISPDIKEFNLEFESRINTDKFIETKNNYYSIIEKISNEYGVDPDIMLGIATQESGIHTTYENGPALGLMQIELSVWENQNITAFNYRNNDYETLYITREKLKDLEFNIRVACMHFQNCLHNSNNNIPVAIQMYNYGYGNIETLFKNYYNTSNIDLKYAIENANDEWINGRNYISAGDNKYLEHVFSYIENLDNLECRNIDNENENIVYKINNQSYK